MSATTPVPTTARGIVLARRRTALTAFVRAFAANRSGMLGVAILAFFIVMAPLVFPRTVLDVTQATGQPFEPPSLTFPLGTDDSGISVLALVT